MRVIKNNWGMAAYECSDEGLEGLRRQLDDNGIEHSIVAGTLAVSYEDMYAGTDQKSGRKVEREDQ